MIEILGLREKARVYVLSIFIILVILFVFMSVINFALVTMLKSFYVSSPNFDYSINWKDINTTNRKSFFKPSDKVIYDDETWEDYLPTTSDEIDPDRILQCFESIKQSIEDIRLNMDVVRDNKGRDKRDAVHKTKFHKTSRKRQSSSLINPRDLSIDLIQEFSDFGKSLILVDELRLPLFNKLLPKLNESENVADYLYTTHTFALPPSSREVLAIFPLNKEFTLRDNINASHLLLEPMSCKPTVENEEDREYALKTLFKSVIDKYGKSHMFRKKGVIFWDKISRHKIERRRKHSKVKFQNSILLNAILREMLEGEVVPRKMIISNFYEVERGVKTLNEANKLNHLWALYYNPLKLFQSYFGITDARKHRRKSNLDIDPVYYLRESRERKMALDFMIITLESSFHRLSLLEEDSTNDGKRMASGKDYDNESRFKNMMSLKVNSVSDAILMVQMWCLLKPKGLLFLNVPITRFAKINRETFLTELMEGINDPNDNDEGYMAENLGLLIWGSHRVYSYYRLKYLLFKSPRWHLEDIISLPPTSNLQDVVSLKGMEDKILTVDFDIILVLRKVLD
ncbi:unnamed protein product [Gordionus sp. m RMFG-2023]